MSAHASTTRYVTMVRASFRSSRHLTVVLATAHAGTVATLAAIDFSVAARVVLAFAVALSLAHALWRHAWLRSRQSILAIELIDRETGSVCLGEGSWKHVRVLGTSYVAPALSVINVRVAGEIRARHLLIVRDNVDSEDFRKLRVVLRWAVPKGRTL